MPSIIKIFVNEKFYGATQIVFWTFLSPAFFGMYVTIWNFISYAERTSMFFPIDIFISLFHLICCYLLVKENGIVGAAQASALSYFVRFLFTWVVSNKAYPMPWFSFYR